jgi:hypothetical protein
MNSTSSHQNSASTIRVKMSVSLALALFLRPLEDILFQFGPLLRIENHLLPPRLVQKYSTDQELHQGHQDN